MLSTLRWLLLVTRFGVLSATMGVLGLARLLLSVLTGLVLGVGVVRLWLLGLLVLVLWLLTRLSCSLI